MRKGRWSEWWGWLGRGKEVILTGGMGLGLTREEVAAVEAVAAEIGEEGGVWLSVGRKPKLVEAK